MVADLGESSDRQIMKEEATDIRIEIKKLAAEIWKLQVLALGYGIEVKMPAEVFANLMLAYRHLEDASMRMGKVLQANDGGISVYDQESTVGA